LGRHKEAAGELERAAAIDSENPIIFLNWAVILSTEGETAQAIAKYERVIELDPKNLSAYYNCAALLEKMGRLDGAIEKIRAAITVEPDNAMLKDILARLVQAQRQPRTGVRGQQVPTTSAPAGSQ
jgi:tetratricopeptide (TPR) repeat protein